jgi:hypothetical protein
MKKLVVTFVMIASGIFGFDSATRAQNPDPGKSEFQSSCAACHGLDGEGKGPLRVLSGDFYFDGARHTGTSEIERAGRTESHGYEIDKRTAKNLPQRSRRRNGRIGEISGLGADRIRSLL